MRDRDYHMLQEAYGNIQNSFADEYSRSLENNTKVEGELTPQQIKNLISNIWGRGANLPRGIYDKIDPYLPHKELPILDRLLAAIGMLDEYNNAKRPAFEAFRRWWTFKTDPMYQK
jgi:hypothetical protein